jgi:hypothetical protein
MRNTQTKAKNKITNRSLGTTIIVARFSEKIIIFFFFRKSCRLEDNMKNMVEPDRAQVTIRYDAKHVIRMLGD